VPLLNEKHLSVAFTPKKTYLLQEKAKGLAMASAPAHKHQFLGFEERLFEPLAQGGDFGVDGHPVNTLFGLFL